VRSSSSVIERSEGPTARSPLRLLPSCCLGAVSPNWRRRASSRFLMYATAFWSFLSLRNQEITQSRHHGRVRAGRRGRSHTAHGSAITFRLERSHVFGHLAGEVEGIRDGALVLRVHGVSTGAGDLRHRTASTGGDRRRTPRPDLRPRSDCEDGRRARRPDRAPAHGDARGWCSPTRSLCRYPAPAPSGSRQPRTSARRAPLPGPSAVVGTRATAEASTAARPPGPAPRPTVGWRARP
jgi:hypothetical protein